ncbi:MAG: MinD/ParA family protein [Brevinema sp.]
MAMSFEQTYGEELQQALDRDPSRTRIITVTSGKGGVGKSNFALNLSISLANMKDASGTPLNKKVVIMDADLGLANINVLLDLIPKSNLYHLLKGQKSIREIITPTPFGVDLVAGASGLSQLANLPLNEVVGFIKSMMDLSYADFIIIDTSAGITSTVTQFATIAHEVIVVTTPEPTSITDAYGVIKTIALESSIPPMKLVINRARNQKEAEKVAGKLISIAQQFLNVTVEPLGFIPDSPLVADAVRRQVPFVVLHPSSPPAEYIELIARRMLNMSPTATSRPSGWKTFINSILGNEKY